jgi:hypothetical protein
MFVEILDARGTGKLVDMAPIAANALIAQGRAKRAFSDPSPATPPLPGGYRGGPAVEAPIVFAAGGTVESETVLVGEHAGETIVPRAVADKVTGKKKHR